MDEGLNEEEVERWRGVNADAGDAGGDDAQRKHQRGEK
jgi:hypothetical protein